MTTRSPGNRSLSMEIVLFPDSKEDWISSSSRFLSLSIAAYLIFSICASV